MADPDRIGCCISGCGRTFKREPGDADDVLIMCGRHWRMGPKAIRDRVTKLRRLYRRRATPGIAAMIHRTWHRNHDAVVDALSGKINDAELATFLETI